MFKPKTFLEVCMAMKMGVEVEIRGEFGIIKSIQREDGSGHNFNVILNKQVLTANHPTNMWKTIEKSVFFSC